MKWKDPSPFNYCHAVSSSWWHIPEWMHTSIGQLMTLCIVNLGADPADHGPNMAWTLPMGTSLFSIGDHQGSRSVSVDLTSHYSKGFIIKWHENYTWELVQSTNKPSSYRSSVPMISSQSHGTAKNLIAFPFLGGGGSVFICLLWIFVHSQH